MKRRTLVLGSCSALPRASPRWAVLANAALNYYSRIGRMDTSFSCGQLARIHPPQSLPPRRRSRGSLSSACTAGQRGRPRHDHSPWNRVADKHGFLLVAVSVGRRRGTRSGDPRAIGPRASHTWRSSLQPVDKLASVVETSIRRASYVTGLSQGGACRSRCPCEAPARRRLRHGRVPRTSCRRWCRPRAHAGSRVSVFHGTGGGRRTTRRKRRVVASFSPRVRSALKNAAGSISIEDRRAPLSTPTPNSRRTAATVWVTAASLTRMCRQDRQSVDWTVTDRLLPRMKPYRIVESRWPDFVAHAAAKLPPRPAVRQRARLILCQHAKELYLREILTRACSRKLHRPIFGGRSIANPPTPRWTSSRMHYRRKVSVKKEGQNRGLSPSFTKLVNEDFT